MTCALCRSPDVQDDAELCNRCWELKTRIECAPALALYLCSSLDLPGIYPAMLLTETTSDLCSVLYPGDQDLEIGSDYVVQILDRTADSAPDATPTTADLQALVVSAMALLRRAEQLANEHDHLDGGRHPRIVGAIYELETIMDYWTATEVRSDG